MPKWECYNCGRIVEGDSPPPTCPSCGAARAAFGERREVLSSLDLPVKNYMRREIHTVDEAKSGLEAAPTGLATTLYGIQPS